MARDKILKTTRVSAATRLQDMSSLDQRILDQVDLSLTPIEERVTALEAAIAALERGVVYEVDLELRFGGRSGSVVFEPVEGFEEDTIDQPVIVMPYVTEGDTVFFNARVVDTRSMIVQWVSLFPAPATVKLVYLIG